MRRAWTVLVSTATAAALVGPAPGDVGSCGEAPRGVDATEYCRIREAWLCRRQQARGELTPAQERTCIDNAVARCRSVAGWPPDCQPRPTQREAQACIDQLRRKDNLDTPVSEIPRCHLCGAPSSPRDAGP